MARKKTTAKRWPPNVGINNGNVRYRRQIPKDLVSIAGRSVYSEYLTSLTPESSFEEAYEASKPVTARYEVLVKSLRNSSIDAYTENEIEALAAAYLKDAGLAPGALAPHMVGPEFLKKHGLEGMEEELGRSVTTTDLMILCFPSIVDPITRRDAAKTGLERLRAEFGIDENGLFTDSLKAQPTIQEIAQYRAAEVATNMRTRQPRTLSWWWNDYLEYKNLTDPSDRATKRKQRHWERCLLRVGDHISTPDSQQVIDDALEEQVEARLLETTPATCKRELSEVLSALNRMAKKQRPKWPRFEIPELRKHKPRERKALSVDEQITLVSYCLEHADDWLSSVFLLELQGGMMAEEISNLDPNDLHLEGDYPHVVLRTGKTVARPRVIPIVLGLKVIKDNILEAISRLSAVKEPSATPRKRLKKLFDGKFSSHSLRHTVRINGTSRNVNPLMMEAICGWSGSNINPLMLDYGNAGLADSAESIREIFQASREIHKHLMHLEEQPFMASNVSRIR